LTQIHIEHRRNIWKKLTGKLSGRLKLFQSLEVISFAKLRCNHFFERNDRTDLKYILNLIGEVGKHSTWKISDVECLGESAEILQHISDGEQEISGEEFYKIVLGISQVLGGYFDAYKPDSNNRWLSIRSIRGYEFDIETEDKELLNKIRNSFHKVIDLIY
jgi:hypothetical protein